jgi:hypothetical protein
MLVYLLCRHLEEERLKTAATIRRARTPTNFPLEVPAIIPGRSRKCVSPRKLRNHSL